MSRDEKGGRDFAFLAIYDNDAAAAAINSLHNTQFGNQEIIVERARFPRARFQQNGGRGGLRGRQFNGEQNSGETGEDNYQQQNALGFQQSNQMGGSRGQDEGNDGGYQGDNGGNNGNIEWDNGNQQNRGRLFNGQGRGRRGQRARNNQQRRNGGQGNPTAGGPGQNLAQDDTVNRVHFDTYSSGQAPENTYHGNQTLNNNNVTDNNNGGNNNGGQNRGRGRGGNNHRGYGRRGRGRGGNRRGGRGALRGSSSALQASEFVGQAMGNGSEMNGLMVEKPGQSNMDGGDRMKSGVLAVVAQQQYRMAAMTVPTEGGQLGRGAGDM